MIWPISITVLALTSNSDAEIKACIEQLRKTHGGTGFMHESFNKNDAKNFTRKWFAWANTLFGELLWETYTTKPFRGVQCVYILIIGHPAQRAKEIID
jgi:meiotically up-regulated gene 157 (Mug157) protein